MKELKKLEAKKPYDVFKVELPPPELKKVELPPKKTVLPDIGFWELLWLLIKSVLRNKAKDAMEGKPVADFQLPVSSLLTGGLWKVGVGIVGVCVLLFFVYYIYRLIF